MTTRAFCLAGILAIGGFALLPATGRAAVVITNLSQPNLNDLSTGPQVGAAILIGSTPINLDSIQINQSGTGARAAQTFAVYSRNGDGTVGSSLFSDFSLSFDSPSGIDTATANSPFQFAANTGYWLMLISPDSGNVNWNFTQSPTYTASFGVSMPTVDTSTVFHSNTSQYQYFNLADGPQFVQVNGTAAAPEPASTCALAIVAAAVLARRRTPYRQAA
jgi:hypothetical protein